MWQRIINESHWSNSHLNKIFLCWESNVEINSLKAKWSIEQKLGFHSHTIQVTILAFLCFSLSSYDLFQHLVKVLLYHSLALKIISL